MERADLETLFERYQRNGDPAALGELYDLAAPELFALASRLTRRIADAEDVIQATFTVVIERRCRLRSDGRIMPLLVVILARQASNLRRRTRREVEIDPLRASAGRSPVDDVIDRELDDSLQRQLQDMPELYKGVLYEHLIEGRGPLEIALRLKRRPSTVSMQIRRGMEMLRRSLPVGLAGAVAVWTSSRGEAAIRAAIMNKAAASTGTTLSVGAIGTWLGGLLFVGWSVAAIIPFVADPLWVVETDRSGRQHSSVSKDKKPPISLDVSGGQEGTFTRHSPKACSVIQEPSGDGARSARRSFAAVPVSTTPVLWGTDLRYRGLTWHKSGLSLVVDYQLGELVWLAEDGSERARTTCLPYPVEVAIRADGNLLITSPNGGVELYTPNGAFMAAAKLEDPRGAWLGGALATTSGNRAYVGVGGPQHGYVVTLTPTLEREAVWGEVVGETVLAITLQGNHAYLMSHIDGVSVIEEFSLLDGHAPTGRQLMLPGAVADVASNGQFLFVLWETGDIAVMVPPAIYDSEAEHWIEVAHFKSTHGDASKLAVVRGKGTMAISFSSPEHSRVELWNLVMVR